MHEHRSHPSASPDRPGSTPRIRAHSRLGGSAGVGLIAVLSVSAGLSAWPAYAAATGAPSTTAALPGQQTTGMMPVGSPDAATSGPSSGAVARQATAATSYALGTDIASYQHPNGALISWPSVAASGQSFTVVKATESTTYTNPYVMRDVAGARAAGLIVGVYHFAHPDVSATLQADYFARQVNGIGGTLLPPALDLETTGGLSSSALITWTSTFLTRVHQDTGRIPMIYSGPSFWSTYLAGSKAFSQYPLWEAHWTTAAQPLPVGGWPTWTLWQYSDGTYGSPAAVPGIPAKVDRDRFAGTKAQLATLASSSRPGIQAPFTGTATAAQFPDSTFVQVAGGPVYEIAGLAPLYLTSWSRVGGAKPVRRISLASFYTLRSSPIDGTFLVDRLAGRAYRVTGGAPVIVTSWAPLGGIGHYVVIDDWDILYAGGPGAYSHLSSTVRDGTFVRGAETGQVYEVAGGAPIFVSSWSSFGGAQPYVVVNQSAIQNAGMGGYWNHLRFLPANGTAISDSDTGQLYLVNSGYPAAVGLVATPFTLVSHSAIANAGGTGVWAHLL